MPKQAKSTSTSAMGCPSQAALAVVLGFVTSAAFATEAEGPAAAGLESAQSRGLEEIIVTAQRRAQSLDKVPISITALSQKAMDDLHVVNFADLATVVPSLLIPPASGGGQNNEKIAIRGVLTNGNAQTTQIYIDEAPIAVRILSGSGPQGNPYPYIFDLDRVEVLRGPQGTLFGSSAMGGVVRFVTPQPDLYRASGFAKADLGYTDGGSTGYEVGVAYGAPISEGVAAFRVSGWSQQTGGWIDRVDLTNGLVHAEDANQMRSYVLRPAFTWAPTEALTITPAVFIQHYNRENPDGFWRTHIPAAYQGSRASAAISEPSEDDMKVSSLAIKYEFANMTFQSDTSYLDREYSDITDYSRTQQGILSGNQFLPGLEDFKVYLEDFEHTHAWQQQFRLSSRSSDSRFEWVAGAYYRRAMTANSQRIPHDLSPITQAIAGVDSLEYFGIPNYVYKGEVLNSYTNFHAVDLSQAVFGEVTFGITSRLKANIGARLEHSEVKNQHQISAGPGIGLTYSDVLQPDQVENPITPRVGLTYQINDDDMVYATGAKGYRAGGGNASGARENPLCLPSLQALGMTEVPTGFHSDSLWSYEVGTKGSMFDRHLGFQVSAYHIIWDDIQTRVQLPSCSDGFTANRGKAISKGFELQLQWLLGDHLRLNANVAYDHAYYPNAAFGAPRNGVTPLLNGAGDKLANVLPWTGSMNLDYSRNIDSLWSGAQSYLRLDYRYLGDAPSLNPKIAGYDPKVGPYQNEGYGVLNIRVGAVHDGLDLSAYVFNATNSDPRLGYFHLPRNSPLFYSGASLRPLTWGFTAMYRF